MGQQGQAMLFLLPSEKGYIHKLQQHGVKVQQGNLMQHILLLQELGTAPLQVCRLAMRCSVLDLAMCVSHLHRCFLESDMS